MIFIARVFLRELRVSAKFFSCSGQRRRAAASIFDIAG
jgi:hypothetical protein